MLGWFSRFGRGAGLSALLAPYGEAKKKLIEVKNIVVMIE